MPISKLVRLGLIATLFPFTAYADDPIPVITVTATRIPTPAQNVPAGVTVITKQEIQARGYTTLAQALNAVPGLGAVQSGGPGAQASVFIRGTNSEDVLVLIDGVPANDPSIANGAFNFGEDTLADIARIEVIRGPMSGLYGSNAIGGVINLITVQGSGKPKAEISLAGGFPAQGQGSAVISGSTGPFDYALTGAIDEEAGFDYTAKRLDAYQGHNDPFRSKLGSVNLGYTAVPGTRVYLVVRARQSDSGFPGQPNFDDPNDYAHDTNLFGKLGVKSELFAGLLTTEFFAARIQDDRHYTNLFDANDPNGATADDHYLGYRTDVQWNNIVHLPDAGVTSGSSVLFGVEYINDTAKERVNDGSVFDGFASTYTNSVDASQHAVSGHFGVQTTLYNRLALTGALREDSVSSFGHAFTGRFGGVLAVPEIFAHLKASYGTGFLAPSLYDLHGVDNYGYVGNPNLKAEHSNGYEAGAQFDLPAFGQADFASLSATYFNNRISNLIENVENADFTASTEENVDQARIDGVETELVLTPSSWLSADLNYTYTNARDATDDTQLLRRPESTGSATLTITPTPRISIVPEVRYVGRFYDYLYDDTGNSDYVPGLSEPGTIVDLSASYAVSNKLSLFVQGKNILGSKFEAVNGLQIPGASVLIGLRATIE